MRRNHRTLSLLAVLALLAFMGRRHLEHHGLVRSHHEHSHEGVPEGI